MFKSKLFWLGALFCPKILVSRLVALIPLLLMMIVFAILGFWYLLSATAICFVVLLILLTVEPTKCFEFYSKYKIKKMYVLVFNVGFKGLFFKMKDRAFIRIITVEEKKKPVVVIKSKEVNEAHCHLTEKGFFLTSDEGNFWTAYGVNYPEGMEVGFPFPKLGNSRPKKFVIENKDKTIVNLFSENDIISISGDKIIDSPNFWINPRSSGFYEYSNPKLTFSPDTNGFTTYLLVKNENKYQLLALIPFTGYYKLYIVKTPKFSVRYDKQYREFVYDEERGYKIFHR